MWNARVQFRAAYDLDRMETKDFFKRATSKESYLRKGKWRLTCVLTGAVKERWSPKQMTPERRKNLGEAEDMLEEAIREAELQRMRNRQACECRLTLQRPVLQGVFSVRELRHAAQQ